MKIISHRGYWKSDSEKNCLVAFQRSFDLGFGTETDVRDCCGELVICHDVPTGNEMRFSEMLDVLGERNLPLAINIKSDGIGEMIHAEMSKRKLKNWFTFDMSVPELIKQLRLGMPAYTRVSDFEFTPACYKESHGIWLDGFSSDWYSIEKISDFLFDDKPVCLVSPELHGRNPIELWRILRNSSLVTHPRLTICTDNPVEARDWFGEGSD